MNSFVLEHAPLKGMNLIEASAGTGKTFNIVHLFLRLLMESRFEKPPLKLDQILVVTYTVAATQELKERVRNELQQFYFDFLHKNEASKNPLISEYLKQFKSEELYAQCIFRLQEALRNLEELQIFTIHGFCQRMLQEHSIASGFSMDAELLANHLLLSEVVDDFWRRKFYQAPMRLIKMLSDKNATKGKKLNRKDMFKFCQRYLEYPNLKIMSPSKFRPSAQDKEEYTASLKELGVLWQNSREEIEEMLFSNALNKVRYKPQSVSQWIVLLEEVFQEPDYLLPVPICFEKFTSSHLEAAIKRGESFPSHPFFQMADVFWQRYRYHLANWNWWYTECMKELLTFCKSKLQQRKIERNVVFFQDLLQQLENALVSSSGSQIKRNIQSRYLAALIDEFQDTDPLQWKIFKTLFDTETHTLFLIGDPKQAIYRFRGADLRTYLQASHDVQNSVSGGSCYTLRQNYRSESALVDALNHLFTRSDSPLKDAPFLEKEIVFEPMSARKTGELLLLPESTFSSKPFQIWVASNSACKVERNEKAKTDYIQLCVVSAVAEEIYQLLTQKTMLKSETTQKETPLSPSHICVLVRKNAQGVQVQEALRLRNIPSTIKSTGNVFRSEEARDLQYVLQAILEPGHSNYLRMALITPYFGQSGEDLVQLQTNEKRLEEETLLLQEYHDIWKNHGIVRLSRHLMAKSKVHIQLLRLPQGKRRLTNFSHLIELLHEVSTQQKLTMEQTLSWLSKQRYENENSDSESYHLRPESDENAVQISTIHGAKGLEYPIVFCPFFWENFQKNNSETLYYNQNSEQCLHLDNTNLHTEQAEHELLAEDLRVMYVALTRAVYRCYLVSRAPEELDPKSLLTFLLGKPFEKLATHRGIDVNLLKIPDISVLYQPQKNVNETPTLHFQEFQAVIAQNWKMASFSYLIKNKTAFEYNPWFEALGEQWEEEKKQPETEIQALTEENIYGMFTFPRGERAGNCIHEIFAELDFTLPLSDHSTKGASFLVPEKFSAFYGHSPDPLNYESTLLLMLKNVLSTPLITPEGNYFTLDQIPWNQRLNELEFTFPLETISPEKMRQLFQRIFSTIKHPWTPNSLSQLETLDFRACQGMMRGFIDLIFCYQDRYYLVDWKSNYLGNQFEAYQTQSLTAIMEESYYFLQSYIYLIALHQYLQYRLPNYSYYQHFGGAYYLFIRGMSPEWGHSYGIFRDFPSEEVLMLLCEQFLEKK